MLGTLACEVASLTPGVFVMQIFYLIPTRQNIGLTSVVLGVVRALQRQGYRYGPLGGLISGHTGRFHRNPRRA
ncbi:MAG: hypothetical protein KDJ28_09720 [Candidatus Competibacteraceae bacterium]|nr:hypothetical protein [Candidatus Competibacteraceae bacterium]